MTKKQFWQNASNWGMICGGGLFAISIVAWVLKLDSGSSISWLPEFLRFVLVFALIYYTGRRNAALTGAEGYPYGRAVGFIFAMMMFAGIVAGVGEFLMANFIAREYYDALISAQFETLLQAYQNSSAMQDQLLAGRDMAMRWMANPLVLIFGSVFNWVVKGGFLGLILAAFVYKKPDIFAGYAAADANAATPAENE